MTTIVLSQPAEAQRREQAGVRRAVSIALTVWLLLVLSLGSAGAFVGPPGRPPLQRPCCSFSRGCESRNPFAISCSRWIFG